MNTAETASRRQTLRLPKRRLHVLLAGLVLLALLFLPFMLLSNVKVPDEGLTGGSVLVSELPEDQRPSPLDKEEEALPDLLAGVVADDENPTTGLTGAGSQPAASRSAPRPRTIQVAPLPQAPPLDASLTRETPQGLVPAPNAQGLRPFEAYKADAPSLAGATPVALVIGGLGINSELTRRAIDELPAAVSLSFAAQAPGLQSWIDRARARGHDVLLEIPMEGGSGGALPNTLRGSADSDANLVALRISLAKAQGYSGLINYQGDTLLRRSDALAPILSEIDSSGLALFLDGSFDAPTAALLASSLSLPFATGNGIVDPTADLVIINENLSDLTETALAQDGAFGVGFAFPQTIDATKGWITTLRSRGLVLVPVTAMVDRT